MGIELGRVSGPLLASNLLRNGVNLAFEDDLIYLDVNNLAIGIKTSSPSEVLEVPDNTRTTNLKVDDTADIADLTVQLNNIQNRLGGAIYIAANGLNGTVSTARIEVGASGVTNLRFDNTDITNPVTDSDIEIKAYSLSDYVNFNTNRVEVTGNLHASGSITANGDITFGSDDTDSVNFKADIASDINPNTTNAYSIGNIDKQWQDLNSELFNGTSLTTASLLPSGIDMLLTQGSIYYVSINGDDTYRGNHLHNTFRTIKHALSVCVPGDEIIIFPGTYEEEFPLTIPQGVAVRGMGLRSVTIQPTVGTNDKDAFLMNGETTVSFLTVKDFYYNATNNTGYAFRFVNGIKTTSRSPYIQYVTVITTGSVTTLSDPRGFDQGDAGRGALADGAVCDPLCRDPAMLFHAVTFICPNADGITATNGVRIEWLNSFTYFANRGIYLLQGATGFNGKYGAEIRSIGSANVYGNYGAVADGADTLGYLIGHNFGYIGTGKDSNNDYGLVVQANEIVEINSGVLYYDSMDHKGDYRVGDIFYVNQETGAIRFNAQAIDFTAGGSIVFEGEGAGVIINAAEVLINYIRIYDNNIDSTVGPVNFYAESETTTLNTHVSVTGDLDVTGNLTVSGNVFLGDTPLDTVNVIPRLTQTIEPDLTNYYSLGLGGVTPKIWRTLFLSTELNVDNVTSIADNTVTTLTSNTDLRLIANGSGIVNVTTTDVEITPNLQVVGTTDLQDVVVGDVGLIGDYLLSGNVDRTGNTNITGSLTVNGTHTVQFDDIKFFSNEIATTIGNNDLELQSHGTGIVKILVNNVQFDHNLTVLGTLYPDVVGITNTLTADSFAVDDVYINDNYITTLTTNRNLELRAAGTGLISVPLKNVDIVNSLQVTSTTTVNGDTSLKNVVISTPTLFTTNGVQNVAGSDGATGFFFLNGWPSHPSAGLQYVQPGWTVVGHPTWIVTVVGDGVTDETITITGGVFVSGQAYAFTGYVSGPATVTQTGNIDQTGNTGITGNVSVNNITGHDYLESSKINITSNSISAIDTDADIILTANGSGGVVLDSRLKITNDIISNVWSSATTDLQKSIVFEPNGYGYTDINSIASLAIPVGNDTNRLLSAVGEIRQNSTTKLFEGWSPTGLVSFNGLYDSDRNTYITAELTNGANDNTLRFGINGTVRATINSTALSTSNITVDNIQVTGSTISNRISGDDLILPPNGTGAVILDDLPFTDNSIINVGNSSLNIVSTGTGYVKFTGTGAVVIPTGVNDDRPLNPELGTVRHNTQIGYMEVWNGTSWIPAVGTLGAAPLSEVLDIMDLWGLVLG